MESDWTSEDAILRDLAVAQGREVPVEDLNAVASNERPPALNYREETEEKYFECDGGGDYSAGPDLELIREMLDMVREADMAEDKDLSNTEIASDHFVSQDVDDTNKRVNKPKRARNVAMASLLETYGDSSCDEDQSQGCMSNIASNAPIDSDGNNDAISYKISIIQSPMTMFQKKSPKNNPDSTSTVQTKKTAMTRDNNVPVNNNKPGCFVPSSHAGERYEAYLKRSKLREQVREDIWTRAERAMKEIDAKRRQERYINEMMPSTSSQDSQHRKESEAKGMDYVHLPQHRHLLTGDCIVCEVLCIQRKDEVEQKTDTPK